MASIASDPLQKAESELAYTKRDEFTSEIYKIEVRNLGIFGMGELKKLLRKKLSLDASKIKSPKRRDFAFICFRTPEDLEKALELLNGFVWKGRTLKAFRAKASADPLVKRRLEEEHENDSVVDRKKIKTSSEATCPLASMPYEEQLKQKTNEMEEILRKFGKELVKLDSDYKELSFKNAKDLPCKFLGIKPAPKIDEYRNKSEFAIGKNSKNEIVVGFRLGCYADGSLEVGGVDDLPHIPAKAKKAAKVFQEFVTKSKYDVFNPEQNSGHFRQLTVRTSEIYDEVMVIVGIYSENLKNAEEVVGLKAEIKNFFENYDKKIFECSSLYYQDLKRREAGQMSYPVELLSGKSHITDEILGLKFRISPLAFFQINTLGAGLLYNEAIQLADLKPHTTVLDICCGTGTIGLCFAKHCKQVVGVEIVSDAVKDAEFNAAENSIENCKFFAGNADDYIQSMVKEVVYGCPGTEKLDLVALIDPPRAGLHNRSIVSIRGAQNLNRLVYISCHPKSAQRNWLDLARPESKLYKGEPFIPKIAVAVDMFPHTAHTELVILFERMQQNESESSEVVNLQQESDAINENSVEIEETNKI